MVPPRSRTASGGVPWDRAAPAPIVLVSGPEELLAERAAERIIRLVQAAQPEAEIVRISAQDYEPGGLAQATSPSLFADQMVVIADSVAQCADDFLADAVAYVASPEPSAVLVLRHSGGMRGKKLLDAVRGAGSPEVACPAVTRDSDKAQFVVAEFRRVERLIDSDAVRALVEAVGSDLREMAAACAQLAADTQGRVSRAQVDQYYGGRVEATGFRVADAAVAGNAGEAVTLARHAMATGVDPVPIVAALAVKLRTLAKVGGARARGLDPITDLGLAPWQVERARRELRGWDSLRLGAAIVAVAQADADVKGASRDPGFAVERAILAVAGAVARPTAG